MRINLVGAFIRNFPFGTEIAFKKGFDRLGGHQVTTVDTSYPDQKWDMDADHTVVFKWIDRPEYWDVLKNVGGKKVVYQPDDLRFGHIQDMMTEMRKFCDYALTFDPHGAVRSVQKFNYLKADRLLVTADDDLYRPLENVEKDIDVCFVGSLTGGENHRSRVRMCQAVSKIPGLRVLFLTDIYDTEEIVRVYNRTKVILNHATDVGQKFGYGYGYQCRHFEVGFTRSCLLSNIAIDEDAILHPFFHDEETLLFMVNDLLRNKARREWSADKLYDQLKVAHRPEHRAQEMVKFLESLQ